MAAKERINTLFFVGYIESAAHFGNRAEYTGYCMTGPSVYLTVEAAPRSGDGPVSTHPGARLSVGTSRGTSSLRLDQFQKLRLPDTSAASFAARCSPLAPTVCRRLHLAAGVLFVCIACITEAFSAIEDASPATTARHPQVIRVGSRKGLPSITEAAQFAHDGDTVEVEAGDYVGGVASWPQSDLTIRAVGGRARIVQHGASAGDKAIWVIKGENVLVENFEFSGGMAPDRNGAGIRHEGGKLTIRNCLFERNQMGLITWNNERGELVIEKSEFRDNRVASAYRAGDPIGHQIYVGSIARFTLRESYVHRGAFGHLVKSRARESYIINNRIADEPGGKASYELEFPNGGVAYVLGNIIQQSAQTENLHVVSFGAEGYRWPQNELFLVNNTLVDDLPRGGVFLRAAPGAGRVVLINNLLLGNARLDAKHHWEAASNIFAGGADVASAASGDYRLRARSPQVGKAVDPGAANGVSLRLEQEYSHPRHSRPLPAGPLNPGALQSVAP